MTNGNTLQNAATHCNTLHPTQTPEHCPNGYASCATHCNTLQHTATHCNTLQHTATHCCTLQPTAPHCNPLHHTVCCSALQKKQSPRTLPPNGGREVLLVCTRPHYSTTHCNSLQHTATHCNTLQHTATQCVLQCLVPKVGRTSLPLVQKRPILLQCVAVCCSVLQCVAVCCSVLQCVTVCCRVLQCVAEENYFGRALLQKRHQNQPK